MKDTIKILILCTGNSCRSQIAHGFFKFFGKDKIVVFSAGVETHGVNPIAIGIMAEVGIDISNHSSNHIVEYKNIDFDYVITVCDHAKEVCPYFPSSAQLTHHNFSDPSKKVGSVKEIIEAFRQTREEIKEFVISFLEKVE